MVRAGPGHFRLALASVVFLHHSTPLRMGAWAVGLFFCLSGYWIAQMWAQKYRHLHRPYAEFLVSRWWRLTPVFFSVTLLTAIGLACGLLPGDKTPLADWKWWASQPPIVGSNWWGRLLPPTWSLDVEMQFYLVAPGLVGLFMVLPRTARMFLTAVALMWCYLVLRQGHAGEAPNILVWIGLFGVGVLSAVSGWRPSTRMMALSVSATAILVISAAAIPATRTCILLRGATGSAPVGSVPAALTIGTMLLAVPFAIGTTTIASGRVDRFLGDLSYPLYLFHWLPREWYYTHPIGQMPPREVVPLLAANGLMSLAGAILILVLIDRPMQRARGKWMRQQIIEPPVMVPKVGAGGQVGGNV